MSDDTFRRQNHGRGHSYYLGDAKLEGVTTIIDKGLPKPALVQWAANMAADYVADNWDELLGMQPSRRRQVVSTAHKTSRNEAAVRGTQVHALADKLAHGQEVPVPEPLAGHVESCVRFLDEWEPETVATEMPVYHDKWLYAGTLDLIVNMAGKRWLLDFKSSKSVYGETAFQLVAYKNATHCLLNGTVRPMLRVDECAVVWLRSDGYDLYPFHSDAGVFREFLYIQQCARAADNCRDYKGDALLPPVRTP